MFLNRIVCDLCKSEIYLEDKYFSVLISYTSEQEQIFNYLEFHICQRCMHIIVPDLASIVEKFSTSKKGDKKKNGKKSE